MELEEERSKISSGVDAVLSHDSTAWCTFVWSRLVEDERTYTFLAVGCWFVGGALFFLRGVSIFSPTSLWSTVRLPFFLEIGLAFP